MGRHGQDKITPSYSPAEGPTVKGEKIEVGLFFYPAGGEGKPHSHPNEQIQVILRGRSLVHIGDEEKVRWDPGEAVLDTREYGALGQDPTKTWK